jgi:peptidoglycan/LPS O-acetylase OafA/YrhL
VNEPVKHGHMPQLDGLRALAALAVVTHHMTRIAGPGTWLARIGPEAVWLFFVLSGFLITGILVEARDRAAAVGEPMRRVWGAFWVRRALRIFPLYYAALAVALACGFEGVRREWPWFAAYLVNLRPAIVGEAVPSLGHFWSLAVEEQFYLLWPPLCLWLPRDRLALVATAAVVAAPIWRIAMARAGLNSTAIDFATPCCLDGLCLGALAAIRRPPPGWMAVAGLLAALSPVWPPHVPGWALQRTGLALAACWLVGRAATGFGGIAGRILGSRPFRYVGRISYGVYVIHAMIPGVAAWSRYHLGTSLGCPAERGSALFLYVLAVTLVLASLSWSVFEGPLNDLKRFFPYVRRARPGDSGAMASPRDPNMDLIVGQHE